MRLRVASMFLRCYVLCRTSPDRIRYLRFLLLPLCVLFASLHAARVGNFVYSVSSCLLSVHSMCAAFYILSLEFVVYCIFRWCCASMERDGGPRSSSPIGKQHKTVVLTPSSHRERYADRHLITLNAKIDSHQGDLRIMFPF